MKCPKCHTDNLEDSVYCRKCATQLRPGEEISITKTIIKPSDELAIGGTFADKYKILDEIGRGGMGVVYKAEDLKLRRLVAIKLLPTELASDDEAKKRFIQEAQAAAALSHPNICTIYEVEEAEDKTYIAMEYIEGESLREKAVKNPLGAEEALDIAIQAASGLDEAHKKGIIHRDIKSANIMVDEKGQAKIMDFGLAKVAGGALITRESRTMGTVAYMSPEQARGEVVDHRTDIWSLGVVLYEILSGQFPFLGDREASILNSIENKEPLPIRKFKSDIPIELEKIFNRALKKKTESRYQTASEMLEDLKEYQDFLMAPELGIRDFKSFIRFIKRPKIAIPAVLAILLIGLFTVWFFNRQAKIHWAREEAIPEIERLIDPNRNYVEAYKLAEKAENYLPNDPKLSELLSKCSLNISIKTEPPGARISWKYYEAPESEWQFIGISPIEEVRVPLGFFRWKMEKEGYETVLAASCTYSVDLSKKTQPRISNNMLRVLDEKGSLPAGMVRVPAGMIYSVKLNDFFIDKYEVTNKQYKEFLDSGGYRDRKYWEHEFIKDGRALSWEEAMTEFVDQTGRPGPSTWQAGDYPQGQDDYPVNGISWYEAAAYAEFVGKSLPTIYHWTIALGIEARRFHVFLDTMSNFKGQGPAPVGSHPAMTSYGAYDMGGNVREWCWNEYPKRRGIRGGAWNDIPYMSTKSAHAPPFDRSSKNGVRCVSYPDPDKIPETAFEFVQYDDFPDFYKIEPVPDSIYQVYKEQFAYDKTDLNAKVEWRDEKAEDWIQEKITFDAAYGNERVIAYLFLPKITPPPYQTVVYFPGSDVTLKYSSESLDSYSGFKRYLSFVVTSGRAVLFPIYKGTFERGIDDLPRVTGENSHRFTEYLIQLVKDIKRSIDYLETRKDIDSEKLAYYGMSWGGVLGAIIPAVEQRLDASILVHTGLNGRGRPEANQINYVTRVKIPTLMLNGRHDRSFIFETSFKPMFDLLGTPDEYKEYRIYEADHFVPMNELIKEVLAWLDRYLGPVK